MLTDYQRYRWYEMLPGISVWLTIILGVVFSFVQPLWVIYFIILFDIYWVLKVLYFCLYLAIAWYRYRHTLHIDWKDKLVHEIAEYEQYHHVVFLTLYNEPWDVIDTALASLADACYLPSSMTVVIAGEARKQAHYEDMLSRATKKYGDRFAALIGTCHPADLPGEIPGKGSNLNYAEGQLKEYIDMQGWSYDQVIATIFDIDTICHAQYFANLTYLYAIHPNPTRSSFQPVSLYNNNIWESQAALRVMAYGTTFWLFTALAKEHTLVTFSSHSMSFQALVDVGYHDKRIVSEDSRIFFQCYLHYDGEYHTTPIYLPVSMDTVRDDSWWQSMVNLYKQQRRWAWGTEHIPFLLYEFKKKGKKIPWTEKVKWIFFEWEGKWSWCTTAIIITFLGRLPVWVAPASVRQSALFFNTPHLLEQLMTFALAGLIMTAILTFPLMPKLPDAHPKWMYLTILLQWLLLPFTIIIMSAIPAIDAVTRLMFGKYLGFNVSQKKRAGSTISSSTTSN
jgi:hypothetical protein